MVLDKANNDHSLKYFPNPTLAQSIICHVLQVNFKGKEWLENKATLLGFS